MLREVSLVVLGGVALLACKQAPAPADQQAPPRLPAASVAAALEPAARATPPPPKLATLSYALFDGSTVVTCTDLTAPEEKLAAFKPPDSHTKLSQTCDSLGRAALTVCDRGQSIIRYYTVKYSDSYMGDCVKAGGKWTTNKSPDAQMARAEQGLAAAKAAAGIP